MTDRSNEASTPGVPIDNADRPAWAADYLSERQLQADVGLQWINLLRRARGYTQSVKAAAGYLYEKTIGKRRHKKAWPSVRELCEMTGTGSQTTMVAALRVLIDDGWLLREVRSEYSRRLAPARPGQAGVGYRLAWPLRDCLAPADGPLRCARPTSKGGLCTTRAGKGTTHPGQGPCWRHGGDRANKTADQPQPVQAEDRPADPTPQDDQAPRMLHLLEPSRPARPVDNRPHQPFLLTPVGDGMLQPLEPNAPTVTDGMLQRLPLNAPAVGAEVVKKTPVEGANEEDGGSADHGAEEEVAPRRTADGRFESDSAAGEGGGDVAQARQLLQTLPHYQRECALARARMDLARQGNAEPTDDQVVLEAAAAARRRTA